MGSSQPELRSSTSSLDAAGSIGDPASSSADALVSLWL